MAWLVAIAGVRQAHAEGDVLYGALIMATKAERPTEVPPESVPGPGIVL